MKTSTGVLGAAAVLAFSIGTSRIMKINRIVLIGLAAMAAVAVCAQVVKETYLPDIWYSSVDGTSYVARLERDAVALGPSWDPAKPLPLSFARAERIARTELRKLVSDEPAWWVHSFEVRRLPHTQQWYYVVGIHPPAGGHKDSYAYVMIDASGKAGSVEKGQLK
jgi:hypothetical protein